MEKSPNPARTVDLVRTVSFSAAHRYASSHLTDPENKSIYGSLYRTKGFGHNFILEAHFTGEIDPQTGMVLNLSVVDSWLHEVSMLLDHRHLNELSAFAGHAPTPERIARYAFEEIVRRMEALQPSSQHDPLQMTTAPARLKKVRLYEGEHLWVDVALKGRN